MFLPTWRHNHGQTEGLFWLPSVLAAFFAAWPDKGGWFPLLIHSWGCFLVLDLLIQVYAMHLSFRGLRVRVIPTLSYFSSVPLYIIQRIVTSENYIASTRIRSYFVPIVATRCQFCHMHHQTRRSTMLYDAFTMTLSLMDTGEKYVRTLSELRRTIIHTLLSSLSTPSLKCPSTSMMISRREVSHHCGQGGRQLLTS